MNQKWQIVLKTEALTLYALKVALKDLFYLFIYFVFAHNFELEKRTAFHFQSGLMMEIDMPREPLGAWWQPAGSGLGAASSCTCMVPLEPLSANQTAALFNLEFKFTFN